MQLAAAITLLVLTAAILVVSTDRCLVMLIEGCCLMTKYKLLKMYTLTVVMLI
jgi:hypothetical protein